MSTDVGPIVEDVAAEQQDLDDVLAPLGEGDWDLPTRSAGWAVRHQIAHLTYFDAAAAMALEDPESFVADRTSLVEAMGRGESADSLTIAAYATTRPDDLLSAWRTNAARLVAAGAGAAADARVPWFGPDMSLASFLTARLMETWAHGQDVVEAAAGAGVSPGRPATDRLRHIAQLGVITRKWSYRNRGVDVPPGDVAVVLVAPSGGQWSWGSDDAPDSVAGPAEDFCLVVTQRQHIDDTGLVVTGAGARDWMENAQAFAGPPTTGPRAATRS